MEFFERLKTTLHCPVCRSVLTKVETYRDITNCFCPNCDKSFYWNWNNEKWSIDKYNNPPNINAFPFVERRRGLEE